MNTALAKCFSAVFLMNFVLACWKVDTGSLIITPDLNSDPVANSTPAPVFHTAVGIVTTIAGAVRDADGTGSAARFINPQGMVIDPAGNLYLADKSMNTVRKITPSGVVTTIAGKLNFVGNTNGIGSAASFNGPVGIARDTTGNLYVADRGNYTIRKITASGSVSTFAGQVGVQGHADGTGTAATFRCPSGITVDPSDKIFVSDNCDHIIRKITSGGTVSTFAGQVGTSGTADGTGAGATFYIPSGIAADLSGNLWVADTATGRIRKITSTGVVTTLTLS